VDITGPEDPVYCEGLPGLEFGGNSSPLKYKNHASFFYGRTGNNWLLGSPEKYYLLRRKGAFERALFERVITAVVHNCNISDARHAGYYSVCGLALRLRDLYKWEKGLAPWVEDEPSAILEWIGKREELWENLTDENFQEITIKGLSYDPFETKAINGALQDHVLFYGAGYVHSLKPTFFLADLEEKRRIQGHSVTILGKELARDLVTLPALVQDGSVIIRRESGEHFLWNQIVYLRNSGRPALAFALRAHGLKDDHPKTLQENLTALFADEMDTYIHHELGELIDSTFDATLWREMIAAFPHSPIELLARTVKDLLADTHEYGTLPHIVRNKKRASLGFYAAFLDGFRKVVFPEILEAFHEFLNREEWPHIEKAISSGRNTALRFAQTMSSLFLRGKEKGDFIWVEKEIEAQLLKPLGVNK